MDCSVTSTFHSEALTWFNHVHNANIDLSNKQIAFNDIPSLQQLTKYPTHRLLLFVILLKQYIYACKCFEKNANVRQEFQRKALLQW